LFGKDEQFAKADASRDRSGCVVRYERTFMRPLLPTDVHAVPDELLGAV
jgi:hypothetical protein